MVIDNLDAVVQIGELVGLRPDAAGQHIGEHLGNLAEGGFGTGVRLALLFMLASLLVAILLVRILLLVNGMILVVLIIGLVMMYIGVRSRNDEFMSLKGVGILCACGRDAKVVSSGQSDLGMGVNSGIMLGS